MKILRTVLLLSLLLWPICGHAQIPDNMAGRTQTGEAYAPSNPRDYLQTYVMMDGVDMKDPKVADTYAQLMYCGLYKEKFSSDFEWNTIRNQIVDKVRLKKEYFRTMYEVSGVIYLGRYNFETQDFPLVNDSSLLSVASLILTEGDLLKTDCLDSSTNFMPPELVAKLRQPLTVERLKVPMDEAEKLLARMDRMKNNERKLFIRFRLRIQTLAPPNVPGTQSSNMMADLMAIDIFYDKEMTKLFTSIPLNQ